MSDTKPTNTPVVKCECVNKDRIINLEDSVDKLNQKIWQGNGQPSLTTQLAVIEQRILGLCWIIGVMTVAVITQIVTNVLSK